MGCRDLQRLPAARDRTGADVRPRSAHIAVHPETSRPGTSASPPAACGRPRMPASPLRRSFRTRAAIRSARSSSIRRIRSTIWVGTGEANNQRSVGYGDGVYRSDDAGRTWRNMGLKTPSRSARIVIDPRDSKVVFVAAYGPLWTSGGDRGLYKTTDGGATWTKVLEISENTGVSDVAIDPNNPDVLLAVAHQRRRHTWTLIHGGPESGLHKSTDGGTDVAAHPHRTADRRPRPHRDGVLAGAERARLRQGGDRRATRRSTPRSIPATAGSGAATSARSRCTTRTSIPIRRKPDRLYVPSVQTQISDDGGRTFDNLGERNKHVDNHYVWIDPDDTDHLLEGCDGGLYETWDRRAAVAHFSNLSVTQFYNVDVDNASPIYNVYGGTQDNSTLGGPSRSRRPHGATNNDWFVVTGGDGFVAAHRSERSQHRLWRVAVRRRRAPRSPHQRARRASGRPRIAASRRCASTGRRRSSSARTARRGSISAPTGCSAATIAATPGSRSARPHAADRSQHAAGDGPDLGAGSGRAASVDRDVGQHLGNQRIAQARRAALRRHRRWAGAGFAMTAAPTGARARRPPGLPDYGGYGVYVQRLYASQERRERGLRRCSTTPRTATSSRTSTRARTAARSWTSIAGDLPANGPVLAFAEDHVNPNLLFAGTEFGLFFTVDGGKKWIRLRGNLPTIAVRDMVDPGTRERSRAGDVRPRLLRARRLHAAADAGAGDLRAGRPHLPHARRR